MNLPPEEQARLARIALRFWDPIFAIYRPHPKRPAWICRMWMTVPKVMGTDVFLEAETLHALRAKLPPGLVVMRRGEGDDPAVEEVWSDGIGEVEGEC